MTFRVCVKLYNEIVCHVNADLKNVDCKQSIHKPYTKCKFPSSSVKQIMQGMLSTRPWYHFKSIVCVWSLSPLLLLKQHY